MKKLGYLTLVLFIALTACVGWLAIRDPLTSLPAPNTNLRAERQILPPQNHRHIEHITLHNDSLGDIGIIVSLPDPLPQQKLPLLIVLGGLGTGENNIRYVGEAGNNAIVGYDWPMPVHFYNGVAFLEQLPGLYSQLMSIPAQVTSATLWLSHQEWADDKRISLLGFSLGALAAPSIQDLAAHNGLPIGWTILAYGGAPFSALFASDKHIKPNGMRGLLTPAIDPLLHPLEPTAHLPYLHGHFLILEGKDDRLIPATVRAHLRDATPEPKTVITFEGDHMGVGQGKMELLQKIIDASKKWLIENGAVNSI